MVKCYTSATPSGDERSETVTYHRRILDNLIDELIVSLPAISIEGPRGIGKTTTAEQRAATSWRLDDPEQVEALRADPRLLVGQSPPILVDEWQVEPPIWDRIRRIVDDDPVPGQFLLTGSALPLKRPTHTGAGRIASLPMRPLTLAERWDTPDCSSPTISLAGLLRADGQAIAGNSTLGLQRYVDEIVASGLPTIRQLTRRAREVALRSYCDNAMTSDFESIGYSTRLPATMRRWAAAYAAATGTTTSWSKINRAASPGDNEAANHQTAAQFREALTAIHLLDDIPAWLPSLNLLGELAQGAKHYLCDPALAVALLGVTPERLISGGNAGIAIPRDGTLLGALFESLAALSIRVYAEAADARVHHMRVRNGRHEVDFIVEGPDQSIVAIEVKLAATVDDRDVRHLNWLDEHLRTKESHPGLTDRVVLTTGQLAYRRTDGVAVIPLAVLGP